MALKKIDWEAIEREFRVGALSIREIGRQYRVSDTAIRKKAKSMGWVRDLTERVRREVAHDLVRDQVRSSDVRTDREIVEEAAARGVEVVRQHRTILGRAMTCAGNIVKQLERGDENEELEKALPTILDPNTDPIVAKAIILEIKNTPKDKGGLFRSLSQGLAKLIPLERQAFNLDGSAGDESTPARGAMDLKKLRNAING